MGTILYHDSYTGPRWTYGLTYRPLGYAQVPEGWVMDSQKDDPTFRFGTVDYPRELTAREEEGFQLTLIGAKAEERHAPALREIADALENGYALLQDFPAHNVDPATLRKVEQAYKALSACIEALAG